jgi:small subunit ribosomal protein S14
MATKALIAKANRRPKFSTRTIRRCQICGRVRSVYRKFKICRICLRNMAHEGVIPGMKKASW